MKSVGSDGKSALGLPVDGESGLHADSRNTEGRKIEIPWRYRSEAGLAGHALSMVR